MGASAVTERDRLVSIAELERDHAAQALADHQRDCSAEDCETCASLAAHVERTGRQLGLVTPAETVELF
jgi:hypothetical protein